MFPFKSVKVQGDWIEKNQSAKMFVMVEDRREILKWNKQLKFLTPVWTRSLLFPVPFPCAEIPQSNMLSIGNRHDQNRA